jgi:hypothetical protein
MRFKTFLLESMDRKSVFSDGKGNFSLENNETFPFAADSRRESTRQMIRINGAEELPLS